MMNTNTLPRKVPTLPSGFVCPSFLNATEQGGGGVGDGVGVDDDGRNVDVDVDVDMTVSDNRREGERERRRAPLARVLAPSSRSKGADLPPRAVKPPGQTGQVKNGWTVRSRSEERS